ncbi:MAG: hypothetical protein ABIB47_05475 [Candidatus Woesearchaeota archaeon]
MKKREYASKVDDKYLSDLSEDVSKILQRSGMDVGAEAVETLLAQKTNLREEIGYLHEHGMPERVLSRAVSMGIVNAQKTGGEPSIRPEEVALSVYEAVRDNRRYGEMARELVAEGIIKKKDVRKFESMLEEGIKEHGKGAKKAARALEKVVDEGDSWIRAAVYIIFAISAAFLIAGAFGASVTGAIIGGGETDFNILFGIMFLLLGLAIHHFSSHN